MAGKFGWCLDGHHGQCPVKIQNWYHGIKRVGRKRVATIIHEDTYRECNCNCHKPPPEKPVRKRRRET